MKNERGLALLLAACLLTACGGGGSEGVETIPPPPPPPAVTYNSFGNLASDQQIALSGVTFGRTEPLGATTVTARPFADGTLKISYNSATGGYTVQSSIGSQAFVPADNTSTFYGPAFTTYLKSGNDSSDYLGVYRPAGGGADVPLTYTTLVTWTRVTFNSSTLKSQHETMYGVGGFATIASDMPRTGSAGYTGPLRGQAVNGTTITGVAGQARVIANFGAQSVQTDLFLNGVRPSTLVVTGSGAIQSNSFAGALSGEGYSGVFDGAFFGPQAAEMGLSFSISNPDGTRVGGVGAGRK